MTALLNVLRFVAAAFLGMYVMGRISLWLEVPFEEREAAVFFGLSALLPVAAYAVYKFKNRDR